MDIYLYLILNVSVVLFGYFVFRVFVRRDYEKKGDLSQLSTIMQVLFFALHANLSYTFIPAKWPLLPTLPENKLLLGFGFGLMALGLLLTLWAMSGLGFKKAVGKEQKSGLKRSGFYQYVRNPQLVFYGIMIIGLALLWPSLYALGWVLVFCMVAHMMVLTEEEHLERVFGGGYADYIRDIPRYLPNLKKNPVK